MAQNKINHIQMIEGLISNDNLEKAIDEIKNLADGLNGAYRSDILVTHSRLSQLKRRYNAGIISPHEYSLEKSRISHSLLDVLSRLKKSGLIDINPSQNSMTAIRGILFLAIVAVLSLLIYWSFQFFSIKETNSILPDSIQTSTIQVDTMSIQADPSTNNSPK